MGTMRGRLGVTAGSWFAGSQFAGGVCIGDCNGGNKTKDIYTVRPGIAVVIVDQDCAMRNRARRNS